MCSTISLGVQSGKVSGARVRIVVAVSSITGFGCELSSQSSDFGLYGDKCRDLHPGFGFRHLGWIHQ